MLANTNAKVVPSTDETVTVAPTDTGQWTQSWELTVYYGFICTGEFQAAAALEINGENAFAESGDLFYLPTGKTTRVETWPGITSAALTPQVATLVSDFRKE
jgi:hypothetical protein